jgi:uncharacterized membrane protein (DUF485 family)
MRESVDDNPSLAETCREITKFTHWTTVPVSCLMVLFILVVALILIFMQADVPVCACVQIWTPFAVGEDGRGAPFSANM